MSAPEIVTALREARVVACNVRGEYPRSVSAQIDAALAAVPVLRWSHPDDGHTGYVLGWTIEMEPDHEIGSSGWTWIICDGDSLTPIRRGRADSLDAAKRAAVESLRTGLGVLFEEVAS